MPTQLSPNHSSRPNGALPRLIILHATGPGTVRNILDWMRIPQSKVSYHGIIAPSGEFHHVVPPDRAAWHAGVSSWNGFSHNNSVNAISLGLAFVNPNNGQVPLTPQQIAIGKAVVQYWKQQYPIEAVTTHAAVAIPKGRKTDPDLVPNFRLEDYA